MLLGQGVILLSALLISTTLFSTELPRPNKFGGEFSLPSTLGENVSLSSQKGKVVLLTFGFTSCPDVCPMILSKLSLVQNELDKEGKELQVLFVSIDPERDNLEHMKKYLSHFHATFIGLRESDEQALVLLGKRYGASVLSTLNDEGVKEFSHSEYVYVIDQDGYVAGFYNVNSNYQELLKAVKKLL